MEKYPLNIPRYPHISKSSGGLLILSQPFFAIFGEGFTGIKPLFCF